MIFLENDAFASIRFHLVYVEAGDYLSAAKTVKEMEECDEVERNQKKDFYILRKWLLPTSDSSMADAVNLVDCCWTWTRMTHTNSY